MNAQKGVIGFTRGDAELSGELIGRMLHHHVSPAQANGIDGCAMGANTAA
jgi:hypothetical protein